MSEVQQLTELLTKYGVLPLLILIVGVLGREIQRERRERQRWQNLAIGLLAEAEKAASLAEFFRGEA